jgi:hypothetical protein
LMISRMRRKGVVVVICKKCLREILILDLIRFDAFLSPIRVTKCIFGSLAS